MKKSEESLTERPFAALELACMGYIEIELAKAREDRDYHLVSVLRDALTTCHRLQQEIERLEGQLMDKRHEIISLSGRVSRGNGSLGRKSFPDGEGTA